MTEPLTSNQPSSKSTRVDQAHEPIGFAECDEATWMALAGRSESAAGQQLDRQTSELLAYVRQQNDEIDSRQSELNARLAQLDNELRAARLRDGIDAGDDLLAKSDSQASSVLAADSHNGESTFAQEDPAPAAVVYTAKGKRVATRPSLSPAASLMTDRRGNDGFDPLPSPGSLPEFEEVDRVVAQHSLHGGHRPEQYRSHLGREHRQGQEVHRVASDTTKAFEESPASRFDSESDLYSSSSASVVDSLPFFGTQPVLSRIDSGVDIHAMATALDAGALESERRLLAERKNELDRRKSVLQRMQDETQSLHREALEMRLVTEQLWNQLIEKAPADHVNELLTSLRTRLDEHYAVMNATISDRKTELTTLRGHIQQKQDALREQSRKLQEWVDSRHEEIKSYAAQLDARELLLDRREHRLQEEFSKWEAQRHAYKSQLQGLLKKLNIAGLAD